MSALLISKGLDLAGKCPRPAPWARPNAAKPYLGTGLGQKSDPYGKAFSLAPGKRPARQSAPRQYRRYAAARRPSPARSSSPVWRRPETRQEKYLQSQSTSRVRRKNRASRQIRLCYFGAVAEAGLEAAPACACALPDGSPK